ncbi:MAG: hypothetical protein KME21_18895 [Desmonostoc vinosum HA7617-LM4]|jgi:hypothetical protein|nr:hypothetical protein [Desmonostoc vinosum HA7617-LM4]
MERYKLAPAIRNRAPVATLWEAALRASTSRQSRQHLLQRNGTSFKSAKPPNGVPWEPAQRSVSPTHWLGYTNKTHASGFEDLDFLLVHGGGLRLCSSELYSPKTFQTTKLRFI